jgi:hypothetical protein
MDQERIIASNGASSHSLPTNLLGADNPAGNRLADLSEGIGAAA